MSTAGWIIGTGLLAFLLLYGTGVSKLGQAERDAAPPSPRPRASRPGHRPNQHPRPSTSSRTVTAGNLVAGDRIVTLVYGQKLVVSTHHDPAMPLYVGLECYTGERIVLRRTDVVEILPRA